LRISTHLVHYIHGEGSLPDPGKNGKSILVVAPHVCLSARLENYKLLDEALEGGKKPARRTFTKMHKTLPDFFHVRKLTSALSQRSHGFVGKGERSLNVFALKPERSNSQKITIRWCQGFISSSHHLPYLNYHHTFSHKQRISSHNVIDRNFQIVPRGYMSRCGFCSHLPEQDQLLVLHVETTFTAP